MQEFLPYHIIAFFAGFLLDLLLGDPHWLPHPVRLIGCFIAALERVFRKKENEWDAGCRKREELRKGVWLTVCVICAVVWAAAVLLISAYRAHPCAGMVLEAAMTYQILAAKCLKKESMKVCERLKAHDLEGARRAVSMIVGRDTDSLDEEGIARAAVETVAENASDGVIAPMLYTAIGGPVLGFGYKAVSTMDSMIGYKNERYLYFGRAAARLDDLANLIPSRIGVFLMIFSACAGGKAYSGRRAFLVWKKDRRKHASPNAGQMEAACAGALGVRLGGPAVYFGKEVEKPWIGREGRLARPEDIGRANCLMYAVAWSCELLCLLVLLALYAGVS